MKHTLKTTGLMVAACALTFSMYSCKNSSSSSSSSSTDSSAVAADTTASATPDTSSKATAANTNPDASFVMDAAKSNAGEIQMLQAGVDMGTNKKLKEDARKMLKDHKALAMQLQDYATKNNITLDTTSSMDMSSMPATKGLDWDKAWDDKMIDGHQQAIAKFEQAQNTVKDPALKSMITATLPTLHEHLDMVQKLKGELK